MTSIVFIYEYATKSKQTFISKSGPETFTIIFILCLYTLYSEILCLETLLETCRAIRKHDLKYKRNIENIFENLTKAMDSSQIVWFMFFVFIYRVFIEHCSSMSCSSIRKLDILKT
jgi:hypothetical protein